MSTKTVYSIRIPKEVRKVMEEIKDINWQDEVRRTVEKLVRKKSREKLLKEAEKLRKEMKAGTAAAKLIREDRDAR